MTDEDFKADHDWYCKMCNTSIFPFNWMDDNNEFINCLSMEHNLPENPLEALGYFSIGCEPCTSKFDLASGRDGRWQGLNKTECGLHTELAGK